MTNIIFDSVGGAYVTVPAGSNIVWTPDGPRYEARVVVGFGPTMFACQLTADEFFAQTGLPGEDGVSPWEAARKSGRLVRSLLPHHYDWVASSTEEAMEENAAREEEEKEAA